MGFFADMIGTLRDTFRVGRATFSSSGLTAGRTFSLPDFSGTLSTKKYTESDTPPVSPSPADEWLKTSTGRLYTWIAVSSGAFAWVELGPAGAEADPALSAVTVDFGTSGVSEKIFDVVLAGATPGQRVQATVSLDMPSGVAEDELEMDPLTVSARVLSAGNVRLIVSSRGSAISGQRTINLLLG